MQEEQENNINRRRLLRRAGTLAAGVTGASVAGAMISSPAQAADADPLLIGTDNVGTSTTKLTAGDAGNPTVLLENPSPTGAALALDPVPFDSLPFDSVTTPSGTIYTDEWGDLHVVGNAAGQSAKYLNPVYSPTWALMTFPTDPIRWVVTLAGYQGGRDFVSGATFDSAGRVMPKNSTTVPDMVIDFSPLLNGGYAAVQANLTVDMGTSAGWVALWGEGDYPGTSSLNFQTNQAIANFTQTLLGSDMKLRVKVKRPVVIILDVQGFVLQDWIAQLSTGAMTTASSNTALASAQRQFSRFKHQAAPR